MEAPEQIAQRTKTRKVKEEYIVVSLADAGKFTLKALILKRINALIQAKSRIVAPGTDAIGALLVQMNLHDITENTRERNRSNVFIAIAAFHDQII